MHRTVALVGVSIVFSLFSALPPQWTAAHGLTASMQTHPASSRAQSTRTTVQPLVCSATSRDVTTSARPGTSVATLTPGSHCEVTSFITTARPSTCVGTGREPTRCRVRVFVVLDPLVPSPPQSPTAKGHMVPPRDRARYPCSVYPGSTCRRQRVTCHAGLHCVLASITTCVPTTNGRNCNAWEATLRVTYEYDLSHVAKIPNPPAKPDCVLVGPVLIETCSAKPLLASAQTVPNYVQPLFAYTVHGSRYWEWMRIHFGSGAVDYRVSPF